MANQKIVLVIDDDPGIQEAIRAILEYGEYRVFVASNESDALKMAGKHKPDLILLDLLLSGKDGVAVAKSLRKNKDTLRIPIIMLSAHPDALKASKEGGADDFIAKPFDMSKLLDKVSKYA